MAKHAIPTSTARGGASRPGSVGTVTTAAGAPSPGARPAPTPPVPPAALRVPSLATVARARAAGGACGAGSTSAPRGAPSRGRAPPPRGTALATPRAGATPSRGPSRALTVPKRSNRRISGGCATCRRRGGGAARNSRNALTGSRGALASTETPLGPKTATPDHPRTSSAGRLSFFVLKNLSHELKAGLPLHAPLRPATPQLFVLTLLWECSGRMPWLTARQTFG